MGYIGKYYIQVPLPKKGFLCFSYAKHHKMFHWYYFIGKNVYADLMIAKISFTIYLRGLGKV